MTEKAREMGPLEKGGLQVAAVVAMAGILWAVYQVAFDAPFYLDSWYHLEDKTNLHMVELSWRSVSTALHSDYGGVIQRPLSNLSLALTHYFFGLSHRAFRIGNLAIHFASCLALIFLFRTVCRALQEKGRLRLDEAAVSGLVFLAAAFWALHPVQTNAVTYVIQRMASLCGLFSFLAVGTYLRARSDPLQWNWRWGGLFLSFLVLAVASKENGVTVVPLVLAAEWVLLSRPTLATARRSLAVLCLTAGIAAILLLAWRGPEVWEHLRTGYRNYPFTLWERLLTEARIQPLYLLLLLVPDPRLLNFDADIQVSHGLLSPPATIACVLAITVALILSLLVRRQRPLLSFGIAWYFVAQLVEGTVLPVDLYYEHRLYIPSAFLFLGIAVGVAELASKPGALRIGATVFALAFVTAESAATYARNVVWSNPVAFWADAATKAPRKARPFINYGMALADIGQYREAEKAFLQALELGGEAGRTWFNLADVYTRMGDETRAVECLKRTVETGRFGDVWKAHLWLSLKAMKKDRLSEAEEQLSFAMKAKPTDPEVWNIRGRLYGKENRTEDAERAFQTALGYDPGNAAAWNDLGVINRKKGKKEEAVRMFAEAVRYAPGEAEYVKNWREATAPR